MCNQKKLFVDSLQTDGRITSLEMHGIQKRYSPEKHYVRVLVGLLLINTTQFLLFAGYWQLGSAVVRWS